jgi:hypothetical protein
LQDFYNILALFALIFIYGHWFLYFQTISLVTLYIDQVRL